jgi:hypothetical protein
MALANIKYKRQESVDRRIKERRSPRGGLYTVIRIGAGVPEYFAKIKDVSSEGTCFLINEGSAIREHLELGQKIGMQFVYPGNYRSSFFLQSEIKHISKPEDGRFRSHFLVGIKIQDKMPYDWFERM